MPIFTLFFTYMVLVFACMGVGSAFQLPGRCDSSWVGAVWDNTRTGGWNGINAYFVVPNAIVSEASALIWVGIDGTLCNNAFFQVGIYTSVDQHDNVSYTAFVQWSREDLYQFDNFPVAVGDIIGITAIANSSTVGTAIIDSATNMRMATYVVNFTHPLSMSTAEWIVEPFSPDGKKKLLAENFSFWHTAATKLDGTSVTGAGADIYSGRSAVSVSVSPPPLGELDIKFLN